MDRDKQSGPHYGLQPDAQRVAQSVLQVGGGVRKLFKMPDSEKNLSVMDSPPLSPNPETPTVSSSRRVVRSAHVGAIRPFTCPRETDNHL
jgi:hypothetical protein